MIWREFLSREDADRANGALAPQRLRRCRAGQTAAQQQEIESLTCHGARPRLESAVAAGCPGLRRRLDAACAIGTGSYPRIVLQIVMDDQIGRASCRERVCQYG